MNIDTALLDVMTSFAGRTRRHAIRDFGPYLRALKKIQYRGAISYECGWKDFAREATASVKGFQGQLREAGWTQDF